jgi:hypothetical protein
VLGTIRTCGAISVVAVLDGDTVLSVRDDDSGPGAEA